MGCQSFFFDVAVNRLAKSITQLTLCQVTTSEVDAATKLLDKACQKLQGIKDVPSQTIGKSTSALKFITTHNDGAMRDVLRTPLAQGCIGSNPVGLANLILTRGCKHPSWVLCVS